MDAVAYIVGCIVAVVVGLLIGIAVVALIRNARRRAKQSERSVIGSILVVTGWIFVILLLFIILLAVFGPVGLVGWGIVAFVVIECLRKRRASQQNGLLWLLVVSAERSMPLGPAIEAFAADQSGSFAWRARRLAELLAAGTPLPDALELCPGLLPVYALPMIRVGSQSGALAPALRQVATVHNQGAPLFMSMIGKIAYIALLPLVGVVVLGVVMWQIIPKFTAIFKDFHTDLPPMTKVLIQASYFFINYWYLFFPLFLFLLLLLVYSIVRYFGWILWDIPLVSRFARRLDSARILDGLALVAGQQRPLADGIATLALSYPKADIRRRLALAAFDIEAGGDWADSLARRSLIRRTDLAVLQAAQRAGNLPWAMQEMADSGRRRVLYRVQAIVQAVFPAAVICLGAIVMFIVVSLFLPLISLIEKLA